MINFIIQAILELLLASLLFFNVFVSKTVDTNICFIGVFVFLILSYVLKKFRRPSSGSKNDMYIVVAGLCVTLLGIFYVTGYRNGFTYSYSCIFKNYISVMTWVKVFSIVVLTELVRYYIVNSNYGKKYYNYIVQGLLLVLFFLIEVNISKKIFDITSFNQLYELFALVFVQSISKNLLLNYMVKKYGYGPNILYRFIMDLYIYFIPIVPKFNVFLEGIILLVYPYLVYSIVRLVDNRLTREEKKKLKKKRIITGFRKKVDMAGTVVISIVFIILVILVSREFDYAMIAIGSESMTGAFNKGDAVVYKTVDATNEKLNKDDVIVYEKDGVIVVHRIVKVYRISGKTVYQTKGDYNQSADNWVVEPSSIKGVVKGVVPIIAWPSVLINELF